MPSRKGIPFHRAVVIKSPAIVLNPYVMRILRCTNYLANIAIGIYFMYNGLNWVITTVLDNKLLGNLHGNQMDPRVRHSKRVTYDETCCLQHQLE